MNFKQTIVSAVGWSVGIKLAFQIVNWVMTLLVIRMLSPDDYGLMAESQIFVNFLLGFGLLGLGDAMVQQNNTPSAVVARVFGVLLLTSAGLTVLLALAAYPIADWYQDQRLVPLIQVVSLGFLFNGLTVLPRAYLAKSLQVRSILIIDLSSGFVGAALVIVLAYNGYGVWALMFGWLVSNVVRLLGFVALCWEYYVWPSFNFVGLRPLFAFGIYRTLEYTVWATYISADVLIISRWLGPTALGVYAVALNFATVPLNKIAPIVNLTAFPAFAMVQGRPAEAQFYALKAVRMMATIAVPVFFGICATAPEVIDLVFGPKWVATKSVLGVLALATTFRAILIIFPNYLQGIGDSQAGFWCTATGAVIFPPAFVIGCQWGIEGVAYAWLIGYPVVFAINALIASRRGGLDFRALMLAPVRPMVAGLIMLAAIAAVRLVLPDGLPRIGYFAVLVAVGVATYCAVLFSLFRNLAMEMLRVVYSTPSAAR
jgi:O-antigen/teichoic acid export membrane protein